MYRWVAQITWSDDGLWMTPSLTCYSLEGQEYCRVGPACETMHEALLMLGAMRSQARDELWID
jgi:7-cyano-7-deazaguanine synthase in queuosine biosynthesis